MMVLLERSVQRKKAESVQHIHCLILIRVDAARSALHSNHTTKENKSIYLPRSSKCVCKAFGSIPPRRKIRQDSEEKLDVHTVIKR